VKSNPLLDSGLIHELVREGMALQKAMALSRALAKASSEEGKRLLELKKKLNNQSLGDNPPCIIQPPKDGVMSVTWDPDKIDLAFPINELHYQKLKRLYEVHTETVTANNVTKFARRLWCLLARYDTIGGAGYQAAIPEPCFNVLQEKFGVTHECFASPLNQYLPSFGSAFPDTDIYFGSRGSVFLMFERKRVRLKPIHPF